MNVLICDDDRFFSLELEKDLKSYFKQVNTTVINDNFNLINGVYDVVFMDIELDDLDGIKLAQKLKNKHNSLIIFISSHENLVFNTFIVEPFQFIRKNHYLEDKEIVFKQLKDKLQTLYIPITLKENKRVIQLPIKDIYSVISIGHDLIIHTNDHDYTTIGILKDFYNKYSHTSLIQVQKNLIINMLHIDSYAHNIISYNHKNITIGRIYRKNFLDHYDA